ncbi:hypothetical protein [Streptomyces synnematoformans]|uniref:Uncharacterized protein n=1 Tax=Streptomyces synnematoformans TaxID=415721 RepID=A0ABN2XCP1_9ACTN
MTRYLVLADKTDALVIEDDPLDLKLTEHWVVFSDEHGPAVIYPTTRVLRITRVDEDLGDAAPAPEDHP